MAPSRPRPHHSPNIDFNSSTSCSLERSKIPNASESGAECRSLPRRGSSIRRPCPCPDEATSALDATSRVLVFEAIKRHRRNRTTIVFNHDVSQNEHDDFLYVLKHGRVVEQGFRHDLEADPFSTLRDIADAQGALGGFPVRNIDSPGAPTDAVIEAILDEAADAQHNASRLSVHLVASNNRLTLSNWMFDAVHDLSPRPTQSRFVPMDVFAHEETMASSRRRGSFDVSTLTQKMLPRRCLSPQFSPTSTLFDFSRSLATAAGDDASDLEIAKQAAASKESRRFDVTRYCR
jgi:ATP-binding cassette, subfamily B (MDR/TAP), member 1